MKSTLELEILLPYRFQCFFVKFYAGKEIPEEGDAQRLMLYAGADHVLHKVWEFMVLLLFRLCFVIYCYLSMKQ